MGAPGDFRMHQPLRMISAERSQSLRHVFLREPFNFFCTWFPLHCFKALGADKLDRPCTVLAHVRDQPSTVSDPIP